MDVNTCLDVNTYRVRSMWQARVETPAAIANRFRTFLALSRPALPRDRRWHTQEEPGGPVDIDLTRDPAGIDRLLAKVHDRDSDGHVWVGSGSFALVFAPLDGKEFGRGDPYFDCRAGSASQNHCAFKTDHFTAPDPRLLSYDGNKTMLLAIARAFEPDWCEAGPDSLVDIFDMTPYKRPPMSLAWMTWLGAPLAALVTPPPPPIIVERHPDGSLFMAATRDTFVTANPDHLAAARAIFATVDPLNFTVPFNGVSGRSDRAPPRPTTGRGP